MNRLEWRAVVGLSLVYALRMLGMFMILPVFAIYARDLPSGATGLQIGFAIGAYGLTQALLQIPLGIASDRIGRKPVIVMGLLIFALGSVIAAATDDIQWIIVGRLVQGMGAVSAAVSALVADSTRESVRTTAMAVLGVGMGGSFVLALVLGPLLAAWHGLNGIFGLTAALAIAAIPVVLFFVPNAPLAPRTSSGLLTTLRDLELLRLNLGIFLLHACMTALFVVLPLALARSLSMPAAEHWRIYLPVLLLSIIPVFALIRYGEKREAARRQQASSESDFMARPHDLLSSPARVLLNPLMLGAILLLSLSLGSAAAAWHQPQALLVTLLTYFIAFNFLEGLLPSLISRTAPAAHKGAALGVYATGQFLGGFAGAVLGGLALEQAGIAGAFVLAAALPLIWLLLAAAPVRRLQSASASSPPLTRLP